MSQSITDPDTHVASWKASGLSQAAYFRQEGLPYHRFREWLRRRPGLDSGKVTYVPPTDHPFLRHALGVTPAGTTTIERWSVGKIDLHIDVVTCPVVRLQLKGGITTQRILTPPSVVERGQVSDDLLVQSVVDKVVDHLPAHRQEQRAALLGALIPRAKLCRWHIALADFLGDVAAAIFDEITSLPGGRHRRHRTPPPGR